MTVRNCRPKYLGGDPSRNATQRYYNQLDKQTWLSTFTEPKALLPALANRSGVGYRDRPLTSCWQSPFGFVKALGLPAARNGAYEETRRAILAEALLGAESGQGVFYSRRKVTYSQGKRYRAPAHTYATVLGSVDELVGLRWLYGDRVPPNNRGWQSSFRAKPDLIRAAQEFAKDPTFAVGEPILLKDDENDLVDYVETLGNRRFGS